VVPLILDSGLYIILVLGDLLFYAAMFLYIESLAAGLLEIITSYESPPRASSYSSLILEILNISFSAYVAINSSIIMKPPPTRITSLPLRILA
jgi:hypothetical protein